tara:strand:+ start:3023 stop:3901 length:879 start_codon:yes stop_codon:yes gene_type:complete
MSKTPRYYVPESSPWPIVGAVAVFLLMVGFANALHGNLFGKYVLIAGLITLLVMFFGWFRNVINESIDGLYSDLMDKSFRWGMAWFIVSEAFFFLAFFGALFYIRMFAVPWLGGMSSSTGKMMTGQLLWPTFEATWPLLKNPNPEILGPREVIQPWGLPLLNTAILLTSSFTITLAHHALKDNKRVKLIISTALTFILAIAFLYFQASEYIEAYNELGLTLDSGIYGSTFFMLTGFHGMHVTLGAIMILVMLIRIMKGHFTPDNHFAFEASAWYWHFVDVIWVGLFIFVYVL